MKWEARSSFSLQMKQKLWQMELRRDGIYSGCMSCVCGHCSSNGHRFEMWLHKLRTEKLLVNCVLLKFFLSQAAQLSDRRVVADSSV